MCLIIVAEETFPDQSLLIRAEKQNSDGAGIGYIYKDKVNWQKGLTAADMPSFKEAGPPWVFHFRKSTVGGNEPQLCHPFPIQEDADSRLIGEADQLLFHNGHWFEWKDMMLRNLTQNTPFPEGPWSDTRAIAWIASIYGDSFLDILDEKIAVLKSNKKVKIFGRNWFFQKKTGLLMSYNPYKRSMICYA